jgi:hypothetical protein
MSTTEKSVEVRWSDLPTDLLRTITKKLHDIFDFIYFRSVCKNWYTSISISDMPPLIPWLFSLDYHDKAYLHFYSIFSDKTHTFHCPNARKRCMFGPSRGYLYTIQYIPRGKPKHFLLNPLTKDDVALRFRKRFNNLHLTSMSLSLIEDDDYIVFRDPHRFRMEFYQPHRPNRNYARGRSCSPQDTRGSDACLKGMHFSINTHVGVLKDTFQHPLNNMNFVR